MKKYPYNKQKIFTDDILAVKKVLRSDFITQGPIVNKFEKSVSRYVNVKYACVTNSATSALHIACLSLDLKSNDELWTVPNSFVASSNCGLYCGAKIDFVDINKEHFNINLKQLNKLKKVPKVLVTVHLGGQPWNKKRFGNLLKNINLK